MKINLHIERLVLEGLPLERAEATLVESAVREELARLLGANRTESNLLSSAIPHAQGSDVQFTKPVGPRQLGTEIAQSVHQGVMGL